MYELTWRKIQERKKKSQLKEVILFVVAILIAMALGGMTLPY